MSDEVKVVVTLNKAQYENLQSMPYGSIGAKLIYDKIKKCKPLSEVLDEIKGEINEERVFARDDFRQYKVDILGVDPETVDDEYPNDEFHKGMERAVDIIDQHIGKGDKE